MIDFLLIGPYTASKYFNIFPEIRKETIRIGYNRVGEFSGCTMFTNSIWFTSMFVEDRLPLDLVEYREGDYDRFDHFRAINIDRVCDIPSDFYGEMGVPITFLDKWCRRQFEIMDARDYRKDDKFKNMKVQLLTGYDGEISEVNGNKKFSRILIKRKIS